MKSVAMLGGPNAKVVQNSQTKINNILRLALQLQQSHVTVSHKTKFNVINTTTNIYTMDSHCCTNPNWITSELVARVSQ